jgi:hypothetical protein
MLHDQVSGPRTRRTKDVRLTRSDPPRLGLLDRRLAVRLRRGQPAVRQARELRLWRGLRAAALSEPLEG